MKLLFVHERFGALGGAESNILATARELRQRGHTVGLLHGLPTGKGEAAWVDAFAHRYSIPPDRQAVQTRMVLDLFQPDVVYVHKMADLDVLEELVTSGLPAVRMIHDHDLYCMRSYKYNYFTRRICRRAASMFCVFPCGASIGRNQDGPFPIHWVSYSSKLKELELNRRFDRLVVATDYMKEELRRNRFDPEKIEIHPPTPPAGDLSFVSTFDERNLIIYAGQIIRGKGVDVLLESLAMVRAPFECFIFGDGNHRGFCENLSRRLGLSGRVHFKGYVSPEELKAYYRECSVAVVTSVWPEPFGAVGLEAMRFGLPVVAFDAGGIREWLQDGFNGCLVPWMDRERFAGRVGELLCDKSRARQLGENGRAFVLKQFDFFKYIDGLEDLFARVSNNEIQAVVAT